MKYDTTPLSIDTAGVDITQPEPEVRFVPDEERPIESGEISHPTLVAKSLGFDTFIEPPPTTNKLDRIKDTLNAPRYRSWALTALLASVSAFAGGTAVYWVSAERPATVSQPRPSSVAPQTEIKTADTFVSKTAADSAAAEPLVPHSPDGTAPKGRTIQSQPAADVPIDTIAGSEPIVSEAVSPLPSNVTPTTPPEPQREAKVGAYVVEKPAGRKPLARCADGTYSYSASKSAACSGRGGVGEWIGDGKPASTTPTRQAAYVLGPRGGCYYLDSSNKKIYVEKKYCEQ